MKLGKALEELRDEADWSLSETAETLGVTFLHLRDIEYGSTEPSQDLLDKYKEMWGVDPYVYAWCKFGDLERLPESVREPAKVLLGDWKERIHKALTK